MAFVTPTTTMMREGIMQSSTKIDSGFRGTLNWGLRNSSIKDFILEFGRTDIQADDFSCR
jgi:deoxycytidine triphosphate deaminase